MSALLATAEATTAALIADAGIGFLLAMALVVLLALLGVVGLVVKGVFSVMGAVLGGIGRVLGGSPSRPRSARLPDRHRGRGVGYSISQIGGRICGNQKCGHRNRPEAVYCSRCGRKL